MKRLAIVSPYLVVILLGILFLILSFYCKKLESLFSGLSSTSFSIVLIMWIFNRLQYQSARLVNQEILKYLNMKIGLVVLKTLSPLIRLTFIDYTNSVSLNDIKNITDKNLHCLNKILENKVFLGFDIFINWNNYIIELENSLNSVLNIHYLNDNEVLWLIDIYKSILTFSDSYKKLITLGLYQPIMEKTINDLKVYSDTKKWATLEHKQNEIAWNYFDEHHVDNILTLFKLNPIFLNEFTRLLYALFNKFDKSPIFKKEFVLDPRMVRMNLN